jgi:hypothetical protein
MEVKKAEINILNKDVELLHLIMAKTQRRKKGGICAKGRKRVAFMVLCHP